jgi:hypothetical protein
MHRTILSWDGKALLGSYMRAKITIGYDRDGPCLYMVYAINTQQWIYSAKIVMNLQSCVRTCMYISLPGRGTSYHPSKCIFTEHELCFCWTLLLKSWTPGLRLTPAAAARRTRRRREALAQAQAVPPVPRCVVFLPGRAAASVTRSLGDRVGVTVRVTQAVSHGARPA